MRWTDDERGDGAASAGAFAGEAQRLVEHMRRPTWVAEDPAKHLLPHLERALGGAEVPLRLTGVSEGDDGTYEVDLVWREVGLSRAARLQQIDPDQLSFTGALRVLRRAIPRAQRTASGALPLFLSGC